MKEITAIAPPLEMYAKLLSTVGLGYGHLSSGAQLGGKQQLCETTKPVIPLPRKKVPSKKSKIRGIKSNLCPIPG